MAVLPQEPGEMMNAYDGQADCVSAFSEGQGMAAPGRRTGRQVVLWIGMALGVSLVVMLGMCAVFLNVRPGSQPLRADAQTLYLADWSKDLDGWSGGAQWHWQEPGVICSEDEVSSPISSALFNPLLLAPYRSGAADIAVDAQIKVLGYGFRDETIFGIAVGVDGLGKGYRCGLNWGSAIQWSGDSSGGVTGFTENDAVGADFSDYVTLRVTIRDKVIRLFLNGQQFAQATAPFYVAGDSVGLYATNGAVEVRGFRVEKLG